jgi:uncharacterized membrane protein HdeD (DUF308 family)
MKNRLNNWQRRVYLGIILIALGAVLSATLAEDSNSLGVIFMALGGLLLISGMSLKKKADKDQN